MYHRWMDNHPPVIIRVIKMGCPCKAKSKSKIGKFVEPATPLEQSFFAKATSADMVPLCLRETINLPVRLPEAHEGKDVVIVPVGMPGFDKVVNIHGHSGLVPRDLRDSLIRRFPRSFACKEELADAVV